MSLKSQRRRRRLSLTSLIDVIFLLLLFFMLSSTFSRFAEIEISAGGGQSGGSSEQKTVLFLRITADDMRLNGATTSGSTLEERLRSAEDATLIVSVAGGATAQALTDVLVVARKVEGLPVTVLEGS